MATLSRSRSFSSLFTDRRKPMPDVVMFVLMTALLALGVVMVYSATFVRLDAEIGDPGWAMRRQLVFAAAAVIMFVLVSMVDYREYRNLLPFMYAAVLVGLVIVLRMPIRSGAQRWIPLGNFQLQPSEFAKVGILVVLAGVLAPAREEGMRWARLASALAMVLIPSALIYKQPDLGTMLVVGFMTIAVLFAAGTTFRQLLVLVASGVGGIIAVWQLQLLANYQVQRVTGFLNQSADLQDVNYNLAQSKIAIGSGQLFGRGLFQGTQTTLSFVPAQTTDFIFTTVGEQMGFIGGAIVIGIYAILIWRILMIANGASDRFGSLIAIGVAAFLSFHIFVNIGMTIGVAPVTGLPLPFVSAGGSAMISMGAALGLVNSVWRGRSPVPGREYVPIRR